VPEPLPDLYCPIQPRINCLSAEADAHVAAWMEAEHLYEQPGQLHRYVNSGFGTFAARVCPDAGPDGLYLFARWLAFGFFYDDTFFDEGDSRSRPGAAADAVMAAVSVFSPEVTTAFFLRREDHARDHRLGTARELLRDIRVLARPEQFHRFCTQMTLWFYSYLYEPVAQSAGRTLSLPGYTTNRLHNIATAPYVTLAEIVTGCPVSADELAHPDVRRLSGLAAYQMAWCNDIHSAARETQVDDRVANLPALLRAELGLDAGQAMLRTAQVHDRTMEAFERLERTVAATASPAVNAYLDLLRTWMRGHYDWCRFTLRYQLTAAGSPTVGARTAEVS